MAASDVRATPSVPSSGQVHNGYVAQLLVWGYKAIVLDKIPSPSPNTPELGRPKAVGGLDAQSCKRIKASVRNDRFSRAHGTPPKNDPNAAKGQRPDWHHDGGEA